MLRITGTLSEIETIISWEKLCKLVKVDYYKRNLVSSDEVFYIEIDCKADTNNQAVTTDSFSQGE